MKKAEKHALQREQCQKNILAVLDHDGIQGHRPFDVWRDRIFIPAVPDDRGLPSDIGYNLELDPIYHELQMWADDGVRYKRDDRVEHHSKNRARMTPAFVPQNAPTARLGFRRLEEPHLQAIRHGWAGFVWWEFDIDKYLVGVSTRDLVSIFQGIGETVGGHFFGEWLAHKVNGKVTDHLKVAKRMRRRGWQV